MKIKDLVCNKDFDVNANYRIYDGIWNEDGECLWDTHISGKILEDNIISEEDIQYITVGSETKDIIIEINYLKERI